MIFWMEPLSESGFIGFKDFLDELLSESGFIGFKDFLDEPHLI